MTPFVVSSRARAFVLLFAFAVAGCRRPRPPQEPGGPAPTASEQSDPNAEAIDIFSTRCAACHGTNGSGDGPAAAGLNPRPRDFHDAQWQTSITDEQIDRIIQLGGAAVGKSPAMPANPDLTSLPAVVAALRAHIRSLRR